MVLLHSAGGEPEQPFVRVLHERSLFTRGTTTDSLNSNQVIIEPMDEMLHLYLSTNNPYYNRSRAHYTTLMLSSLRHVFPSWRSYPHLFRSKFSPCRSSWHQSDPRWQRRRSSRCWKARNSSSTFWREGVTVIMDLKFDKFFTVIKWNFLIYAKPFTETAGW